MVVGGGVSGEGGEGGGGGGEVGTCSTLLRSPEGRCRGQTDSFLPGNRSPSLEGGRERGRDTINSTSFTIHAATYMYSLKKVHLSIVDRIACPNVFFIQRFHCTCNSYRRNSCIAVSSFPLLHHRHLH